MPDAHAERGMFVPTTLIRRKCDAISGARCMDAIQTMSVNAALTI